MSAFQLLIVVMGGVPVATALAAGAVWLASRIITRLINRAPVLPGEYSRLDRLDGRRP